MSDPRVSVVIPLYNKSGTIERSLNSIFQQTFTDFEIIVVNDGSTDDGASRAQVHSGPRARFIHQTNAGPGAARNRGVAESRGALIAFLDADDEWLPLYLERSVATLDAAGPTVVSVTSGYFQGSSMRSTEPEWRARGLTTGQVRFDAAVPRAYAFDVLQYMNSWSTVIRRTAFENHCRFYERHCTYGEDSYLMLEMLLVETIAIVCEPLVHWHDDDSDLSRNIPGARPVEPQLTDPQPLYAVCPPHLRPLLDDLLAISAGKTACMLGFWGDWREGQALNRKFNAWRHLQFRSVQLGLLCATPLAAELGRAVRMVSPFLPGPNRFGSASWDAATLKRAKRRAAK